MSDSVNWPSGWPRTENPVYTSKYQVSLSRAFDEIESELDRIGADDFEYSFDAPSRKTDQRPYANASPDTGAFVLRWTMDGDWYAVACDHYTKLRDNARTVGLWLREKRKMENRDVMTGESEFSNARLPPGEAGSGEKPDPYSLLGVPRSADRGEVKSAARRLKKEYHPDNGGDRGDFTQIVKAEEKIPD